MRNYTVKVYRKDSTLKVGETWKHFAIYLVQIRNINIILQVEYREFLLPNVDFSTQAMIVKWVAYRIM